VFGGAGEAAGFGDGAVAELMKFRGNSKLLSMIQVASGQCRTTTQPVLPYAAARCGRFQTNERNAIGYAYPLYLN
jgi:hypothetical protein